MPKRILLVDDDYVVHRYITKLCKPYLLRHAWNAAEARKIIKQRLKKCGQKPFDLVICDVHMTPHDKPRGFLLAKQLRKSFPKMPVIMHSDDLPVLRQAARLDMPTVFKLDEKMLQKLGKAVKQALHASST